MRSRNRQGHVSAGSISVLLSLEKFVIYTHCLVTLPLIMNETLKWLSSLPLR